MQLKIVTYRELESKDSLLPLLDHAFRWPFNQRVFDQTAKIDPRLKNGPVGFCAVEDNHVVGYVGVMDLTTRTLDGAVEYIGGLYGVATLPSHVRQGISTALINRAHQHFEEENYPFSLLGTSRTLVAHSLYEKLGYTDLLEIPSAYKIIKAKGAVSGQKRKAAKLDLERILRLYIDHVKGKTGLTVRSKAHMRMLKRAEGLKAKECIIGEDGYVLFKHIQDTWVNGVWIRELVALNTKEMSGLLDLVEGKAKDLVYDRAVLDSMLLQVYRSRGYMIQKRSHSVLMIKPLKHARSFSPTYGDEFYVAGLDFF